MQGHIPLRLWLLERDASSGDGQGFSGRLVLLFAMAQSHATVIRVTAEQRTAVLSGHRVFRVECQSDCKHPLAACRPARAGVWRFLPGARRASPRPELCARVRASMIESFPLSLDRVEWVTLSFLCSSIALGSVQQGEGRWALAHVKPKNTLTRDHQPLAGRRPASWSRLSCVAGKDPNPDDAAATRTGWAATTAGKSDNNAPQSSSFSLTPRTSQLPPFFPSTILIP